MGCCRAGHRHREGGWDNIQVQVLLGRMWCYSLVLRPWTAVSPAVPAQGQPLAAALHLGEMHGHFPLAVLQPDHMNPHHPLGCDPGSALAYDGDFSISVWVWPGPWSSGRDTAA